MMIRSSLPTRVSGLLRRRERGQVIPLIAVAIVALVGMAALVVDAGLFLETQRELQQAADASALAGIPNLPNDPGTAQSVATSYATTGSAISTRLCSAAPNTTATPGVYQPDASNSYYTLTVTLQCTAGYTLGRILDLANMSIRASATAALGSVAKAKCPFPFTFDAASATSTSASDNFGYSLAPTQYPFNLASTTGYYITCLDAGGKCGGTDVRSWLGGNCQGLSIGTEYLYAAGSSQTVEAGPVLQGLGTRGFVVNGQTATCPDSLSSIVGPDGYTVVKDSICLGVIPILQYGQWPNGNSGTVNVLGFLPFFIESYAKNGSNNYVLTGSFVKAQFQADMGGFDPNGTPMWRLIR